MKEAIVCMAEMFDYAENHLHMDCKNYFKLFNNTHISEAFDRYDMVYIYGKSSIEIVNEVLGLNNINRKVRYKEKLFMPGDAYWTGMIVASYCFAKHISFRKFEKLIDIDMIKNSFNPLHEAPHEKAIQYIDMHLRNASTHLARYRKKMGLSQSELSILSGVSLRSIQMYEERNKDINAASFETVKKLSKILRVNTDDLYECSNVSTDNLIHMY